VNCGAGLTSVLLEENTRRAFRRAVEGGSLRVAVVPLGATEQHNEHLAMGHDARTVLWIAARAAERLFPAVVVAPAIPFGISGHWMDHPGTLTLAPETFTQVVYELCDSLRRGGLSRILILNGHGGNRRPLETRMAEFRERLGIRVELCSYWEAYSPEAVSQHLASGECPGHAGKFETSTALAIFPETVHLRDEPYPEKELRIADARRAADDRRFFAAARHASAEKGTAMLEMAVAWVAARLRAMADITSAE
jgi:creatinine amidohydrolase